MKLWNSNRSRWLKAAMDRITNCIVTITQPHHEIHDGKTWFLQDITSDMDAEAGDFISIQFTTPAATAGLVHVTFDAYVGAAYTFDIREGQTGGGTGGSALTAYNRRRGSANTHGMTFTKDDTIGTGGTVFQTKFYGSGSGPFATGGSARDSGEWVLDASTLYQVRAYSVNAVEGFLSMEFYLHIDKDDIS